MYNATYESIQKPTKLFGIIFLSLALFSIVLDAVTMYTNSRITSGGEII